MIEKDELLLKSKKLGDLFNSFIQSITNFLDLFERPEESADLIFDCVDRFCFHPSIKNIKRNYKTTSNVSFSPVLEEFVTDLANDFFSNKAAGGEMPMKMLK